jgi:hypothetical protein
VKVVVRGTGQERDAVDPRVGLPAGFCALPFVNLHVSTSGAISPCCEFAGDVGNVGSTTLDAAWSGPDMAAIRDSFRTGTPVAACWKCADRERNEGTSLRLDNMVAVALMAPEHRAALTAPPWPRSLDLRFSNLCNFRCRTCWHGASSKWFMDGKAIGVVAGDKAEIRSFEDVGAFLDQVSGGLPGLAAIYFAGGEPLLMAEHYALLERLIAIGRTDIALSYNSNLSVTALQGRSILDLWAQFPNLRVEASVDAAGARGAFIRKEFDWSIFVANVAAVRRSCPAALVMFGVTVSVFNVMTLTELLTALMTECAATPDVIHLHSLQDPAFYRTQILPAAMKQRAGRSIAMYVAKAGRDRTAGSRVLTAALLGIVRYMNAEDRSAELPRFRERSGRLDVLRQEDWRATLPELADLGLEAGAP